MAKKLNLSGCFFIGFTCLFSSGLYSQNSSASYPSNAYEPRSFQQYQTVADRDGQPIRRSDWDYKESWRYYKEPFFRGETQSEAKQRQYLDRRPPGVGDPQDRYWRYEYQYYDRPFYDERSGYYIDPRYERQNAGEYRYPNYYEDQREYRRS